MENKLKPCPYCDGDKMLGDRLNYFKTEISLEMLEELECCISFPPDRQNGVVDWVHIQDLIDAIKAELGGRV